jgi:putative nucleotidyltransferase with HDIG domain
MSELESNRATGNNIIDLRQAIYALSDALDLVGVDEVGHGKRVGFMAAECARVLPLSDEARIDLFHAALLHDCGVSSTRVHQHLLEEMEWDHADVHCRVGHDLLIGLEVLAPLAPVVRYHHTRWEELCQLGLAPQDALFANLIFLVDRVDSLMAPHYGKDLLMVFKDVRARIAECRDTLFAPQLVDAFLQVSSAEAFWLSLESPHLERYLFDMEREFVPYPISFAELKRLANIFAHIVDAKSEYTAEHSHGVASLARYLAEQLGLSEEQCEKVEVAGLLHDLGKLKIPDDILDKPTALNDEERSIMLRHSFESYQILRRIDGLEEIALWAAYHHEMPAGNGYPFHANSASLGAEARIIAVADVFQALAQSRPYRDALPPAEIDEILEQLAAEEHLDRDIVKLVIANLQTCWQRATLSPEQ